MHIDFSVRGAGEPLVLIHGLFGTRENLGAIAKALSEDYTVYAIDLPNHGRSAHQDEFDLASMAASVIAWMDENKLESAHLWGHSLGGKVAMEIALAAPQRVRDVVVADIAPVRYTERHGDVFEGLFAIDLDSIKSRSEADAVLAQSVTEPAVRSFLLKNLQRDSEGKFSWRMNLAALHACYSNIVDENRWAVFDKPVLFLKAENSDYILAQHKEAIEKRFPQASLKMVGNTGHWLHAEKPSLIVRLTQRFLDSNS